MLDAYIGGQGMAVATAIDIEEYRRFLYAVDHLGLTNYDLDGFCQAHHALVTDLGSLWDANGILGYVTPSEKAVIRIVEIGAGYGRLAEVLHNVLAGRCRYTIVDSVPVSLMFSYCYLRRQLPNAKIGSFYAGDAFTDEFDIYITPSWELQNVNIDGMRPSLLKRSGDEQSPRRFLYCIHGEVTQHRRYRVCILLMEICEP